MDAYSVCHGQKIGEFVESELLSVTSDGRVAPASRPSLNANPDSRQSIHTADMVDLENEDIKETIQSELLRNTSNVKVTPASPSSLNTTQITCQSIHTVDVVDLENEDIKETVQSDIGTHRGTGYSFTSNQLQENSYNAEPFTISTRPSNLQKGDVVELTSDGSEGVQQGSNYKVIRLNNPPSLQSLVRSPGQGEELEDGEIVDADAGAGQIPRTGTGYSLTHNQLCESFVDSNTRLVGTKFFQPEKPSIITTTSDCQVTFGPLLKPLAVLFSFYFPDLNASMGIIVPKDSEEYKLEPELFVQQKAPVVKESLKIHMSEASRDPKDEWWHIIVEVREGAKKRNADEAVLKLLQEGIQSYDGFTQIAARMVGNAALDNREALEEHSMSSSKTSRRGKAESKSLESDESTQGKGKAKLTLLEEPAKGPPKKKHKTKSKKKSNVKRPSATFITPDESKEHWESQHGESPKGETSPSEVPPFTFDFEDKSSKERFVDNETKGSENNDAPLPLDAKDDSKGKGKRHPKGAKSITLVGYEISTPDSNRDAAVERLKSDPQRGLALKLDISLLEDVEEAPNPTKAGSSSPTLGVAATAETSSADGGDWQTVINQKYKKHQNKATTKDEYETAHLNPSAKDRPTEIVATSSDRDSTPLSSKGPSTTSNVTAQAPDLDLVAASFKSAAVSPISEPKVSENTTTDEHDKNSQGPAEICCPPYRPPLPSRNLHAQNPEIWEATKAGEASMSSQEQASEDEEIALAAKPVDDLSDKEGTLKEAEELRKATNAWKDQSDDEIEDTTDRQRLLRDPLFHSENNEAYVFRDRPFVVPPQLESEENIRSGTCFPHLQIFLGDPYTGGVPDQMRRDPATPPLICKCAPYKGNHALVEYEPSIHRMVIHPMPNPRPDHRNNPYHPDYLPPFKQAEYQAYEQAGYPVYRFDRVTFECNLSTCRKDLKDHVRSTVLCTGCGPCSDVRYCSKEHLFEDCQTHWQLCGLTPPRVVWDDWTMPSRYRRRFPAIKDRRGRTTPERHRQQAYSIHHHSSDYVIFNDWKDKEETGEECRATGKPILFLIFRNDDPMKDRFNRLLNIAFFDHYHANVIVYLYRIIRRACRQQRKWTNKLNHQLCHQLFHEFFYDPRHLVSERNDCSGDWDGVMDENCGNTCKHELAHNGTGAAQFCAGMEAKHWILRVWRRQHPEKIWVQRMLGVGFPGVAEEKQRLYKAGEGWDGWGVEENEVCD